MNSNPEIRQVQCELGTITYTLTRKSVKNINLRIKPEGSIQVSASPRVPASYIDDFIRRKQRFIVDALKKYAEHRKAAPPPREYVSGENFTILGRNLQLKVTEAKKENVTSDGIFIYLTVKDSENFRRREKLVNDWLMQQQISIFDEICRDIYQIFQKYNIPYPEIKIRRMTSRWGSCQPRKGIITLNSRLAEAPRNAIEYVVLHEFAHFIHPNHSRDFYSLVSLLMPDWKERKKELEHII